MTVPVLTTVRFTPPRAAHRPRLLLGPSLGTAVATLWGEVAALLADRFDIVGWDLPGHGRSAPAHEPFGVAELAVAALAAADRAFGDQAGRPLHYVGDSVGGAVGLQLALDAPARLASLTTVCSSARFGTEAGWRDRAETVRRSGTPVMVASSAQRWFAPDFLTRRPAAGSALLHDLQSADAESYALVCEALATFDLRERLRSVRTPTIAVAGALDPAAPPADSRLVAMRIPQARYVELPGVAHQAPVEDPEGTAAVIDSQTTSPAREPGDAYDAGMAVRRQVLGDAHVDRATAAIDDTTRDFQEFITRYAWGSVWTRPGLDRRSRSMITLTALAAHGHWEELAMHVRAALTNGLTRDEIAEVLLQVGVYCGVPTANSAFRVAQRVFAEPGTNHDQPTRDQPAHDQPAHDQPAHDQPVPDQPIRDQPDHDQEEGPR